MKENFIRNNGMVLDKKYVCMYIHIYTNYEQYRKKASQLTKKENSVIM